MPSRMGVLQTLSVLDKPIGPGSAFALFRDGVPNVPQNAWHGVYNAVLSEHGHEDSVREVRRIGPRTK